MTTGGPDAADARAGVPATAATARDAGRDTRSWLGRHGWSLVAWLLPLATWFWVTSSSGQPGIAALYMAYAIGCVALPGAMLLRVCWPSDRSWTEEAGLGFVVGIGLQLPGWVIFTALGLQRALVVWPLLVIAVIAGHPRLRTRLRAQRRAPLPAVWSIGIGLVASVALVYAYGSQSRVPMPPTRNTLYPDLLWHLSVTHELMRSVVPQTPQVSGVPFHYHWFTHMHLAVGADTTGIDPRWVLYRLYLAPVVVFGVIGVAAVVRMLTKVWWVGLLGGFIAFVGAVAAWTDAGQTKPPLVYVYSPSQSVGTLVSIVAGGLLLAMLWRSGPRWGWLPTALTVVLCAGIKPTALPMLCGALGLAVLGTLLMHRRLDLRATAVAVGLGLLFLLASTAVVGSTGGSRLQLFAAFRILQGYQWATGDTEAAFGTGGWLLNGLHDPDSRTLKWLAAGLIWLAVSQLAALVTLLALIPKATRRDPVTWAAAGAVVVSLVGLLLLDHNGAGQWYFLSGGAPFAVLGFCLMLVAYARAAPRVRRAAVLLGMLAGAAITLAARWTVPVDSLVNSTKRLGIPPLIMLLAAAVVGAVLVVSVRRHRLRGPVAAVAMVSMVGGSYVAGLVNLSPDELVSGIRHGPTRMQGNVLSMQEQRGAAWLARNSAPNDVVVSSTWCRNPTGLRKCDARGYLVSGIGGRRVLLEGWTYTPDAAATIRPGANVWKLDNPWPDRERLSLQALTRPTAAVLDELRRRGVRWIFADARSAPVDTAALGRLAQLRWRQHDVSIYHI